RGRAALLDGRPAARRSGHPRRRARRGGEHDLARHGGDPRGRDEPRIPFHERAAAPDHRRDPGRTHRRRARGPPRGCAPRHCPPRAAAVGGPRPSGIRARGSGIMTLLTDAIAWIFASEQWSGDGSLLILLLEQQWLTAVGVVAAAIIAVPAGWLIGHT